MLTFNIAPDCETTGNVFPPEIQNRDWVGYHGTASAYSALIESEGFDRRNRPISHSDIDFVADLAVKLNADDTGKVRGFKELKSISFSNSPLLALSFAVPGRCAGQGVGFVCEVATVMLEQHSGSLTGDESAHLKSIVGEIKLIQQSQPVIYAFDLRGIELATFQNTTAAIHIYEEIPATRILAKAHVLSGINYAAIDGKSLRDEIRYTYRRGGDHWVCRLRPG